MNAAAASSAGGEAPTGAVAAIAAELKVEGTLLEEDLQRHAELSRSRAFALSRLAEIYDGLDAALRSSASDAGERIEMLMRDVEVAESDRTKLLTRERSLVDRIQQHRRRIALLEEELRELEGRRQEEAGELSGSWEIVLMPSGQRGTFQLSQTGTLVTGTYRLEGGWNGSVQGTLVKRKVYLVRIDSQLGKSMELEGTLSGDGKQIRGIWQRHELADAEGGSGEWSAKKRSD
jgi:hypothetical protein